MRQSAASGNSLPWDSMCLGGRLPTHTSVPSQSSVNLHQSLAGSTVDRCNRPKPHWRDKLPSKVRWIAVTIRNSTRSWRRSTVDCSTPPGPDVPIWPERCLGVMDPQANPKAAMGDPRPIRYCTFGHRLLLFFPISPMYASPCLASGHKTP